MSLLKLLQRVVKESGKLRWEIAESASITPAQLSEIMHGKRSPTIETADRIFRATGRAVVLADALPPKKKAEKRVKTD